MTKLLLIAVAGGFGAALRHLIAGWGQRLAGGVFPVGTLLVNVVGCLAIGFIATALAGPVLIREEHKMAVLIGLLGGFTTFSTFGWETVSMLNDGQVKLAIINIVLSNALGIAAVLLGLRLARRIYGV